MAERNKATEKPPSFGEKLEHSKFVLVLMLLMVLAVSLIVMIIPENDADIHFVAGQYSPYTLFSKLDFSGEDKLKTRALREQVASQAPYYFKIQPEASAQITEHFQDFFAELRKRGNAENKGAKYLPSPGDSAENLAAQLNKNTLDCLLQIADNPVQMKMYSLFEGALNNGIISNEQKGSLTWDKHIRIIDAYKRQRDSVPMREIMPPLEAAKSVVNATLEYYNDPNKDAILASIEKTLVSIIGNGNLAELLRLNILARRIEDEAGNWTRFVIIANENSTKKLGTGRSRKPGAAPAEVKTSMLFTLPDQPGALSGILDLLAQNHINMCKLESRPLRGECWHYAFFADVDCDLLLPEHDALLRELGNRCMNFRLLGTYERGLDGVSNPDNEPSVSL